MQNNDIKINELGRWIAILLLNGTKRIILIVMYRIPMSSNIGVYISITQYNQMKGKMQSATHYRKEILKGIKDYLAMIEEEYEIVIGGNLNQDIMAKEIREFYSDLGVGDVHSNFNMIDEEYLDHMHITGSKCIDLVVISYDLIDFVEDC